jgi:hypothetical protein
LDLPRGMTQEKPLPSPLFCICGFSSTMGNKIGEKLQMFTLICYVVRQN